MGLIKQVTLKNGSQGSYWSIEKAHVDFDASRAVLTLSCYLSREFKKQAGSLPVCRETIIWEGDQFPFSLDNPEGNNIRELTYLKIKTDAKWVDAQDVLEANT